MKTFRLSMLLAACLVGNVLAMGRLGPPASMLDPAQIEIGLDYTWTNYEFAMDSDGGSVMGTIAIGVVEDRVDVFGRVGGSELDDDVRGDSDTALVGGVGTRITTNYDEVLPWGIAVQGLWADYDFRSATSNFAQFQIAGGPCWRPEGWLLYGGPMYIYIDTETGNAEDSDDALGGYIGGGWRPADHLTIMGEYQRTGDHEILAASLDWRF